MIQPLTLVIMLLLPAESDLQTFLKAFCMNKQGSG